MKARPFLFALLCAAALAAPHTARAQEPRRWTTLNTVLAASSTLFLAMDWSSTVAGVKHPELWREGSFLMPRHPSVLRVDFQCAATVGGNLLLAHLLPNPWRNLSLAIVTLIEIDAIRSNVLVHHIGFSLPF